MDETREVHVQVIQALRFQVLGSESSPGQVAGPVDQQPPMLTELRAICQPARRISTPDEANSLDDIQAGRQTIAIDAAPQNAQWNGGTQAVWTTPCLGVGLRVTHGDVTFARDYDRMWPDSWSGQCKVYLFSWDGCARPWTLPAEWATVGIAVLYPLTPEGRAAGRPLSITDRTATPTLLPQVPYLLVPEK